MSPVWSILQQLYLYTSLLDRAIQHLCGVSITHHTDDATFCSFCSTTILASNQRDAFLEPRRNHFTRKHEKSLRSMPLDKHGWARCTAHETELSILHKRLGDDAMEFILTKCSLFACIGKNYLQISGLPIYNVLALNYTPLLAKRPPMKRKRHTWCLEWRKTSTPESVAQDEALNAPEKKQKLGDAKQDKQVHLDCRSNSVQTSTAPRSELPGANSCVTVSSRKQRKLCSVEKSLLAINNRRKKHRRRKRLVSCLKRQTNGTNSLSSAERCVQKKIYSIWHTSYRKMDIMYSTSANECLKRSNDLNAYKASRRGAIKLIAKIFTDKPKAHTIHRRQENRRMNRLSKRLQPLIPLFQQMLTNYKKTERRLGHVLHTISPMFSVGNELKEGVDKPPLLQLQCNQLKVMRFLVCTMSAVVPAELWSSNQNKSCFFAHLQRYVVSLRKWERMTVRQLVQGVKSSHCTWLTASDGEGSCRSDSLKRTEMIGRFFDWLMILAVNLMKGFFYATEHCDYHNRVVYYRKPVWNRLVQTALDERQVMYQQLSQEEVDLLLFRGKCLGVSNLRFMPKTSSLRPITNLGTAAKLSPSHFVLSGLGQRHTKSVNAQLQDLFTVLKFEKSQRPCSSSCLGYSDIHQRLNVYSKRLHTTASDSQRRPLYIVHTDITNCFDSIQPRLLYSVIQKKILTHKTYLLRRYATVMLSNHTIKRSFIKTATTREKCEPLREHVAELPLRNAIITDMVAYPLIERLQLLSVLKSHLFNNIVKFRGKYYRQMKGIPQGSCISSLLCSFYYDEMVKTLLPVNLETELLMHYIDDFLLVTPHPNTAKAFLQIMTEGIPEYNCFVNPTKTCTNFTVQEDGSVILNEEKEWMAWCGLLINTRHLEVRSDYSRYSNKKIRDHLTVITHTRPFHNLHRLITRAVDLKCRPIFLDCELLSEKTVLCNIYQLFLLLAVKTHAAVRALQLHSRQLRRYTKFLFAVIKQSTKVFYKKARSNCRKFQNEDGLTTFTLPQELCIWLGCHAYKHVLQKKDCRGYQLLIKILSSQISAVADAMGLQQVKRCLRATTAANCQPIIRLKC